MSSCIDLDLVLNRLGSLADEERLNVEVAMSPIVLRQFWSWVDEIQATIPWSLDDRGLEQWFLNQLDTRPEVEACFSDYIRTRLPLIRAVAQG